MINGLIYPTKSSFDRIKSLFRIVGITDHISLLLQMIIVLEPFLLKITTTFRQINANWYSTETWEWVANSMQSILLRIKLYAWEKNISTYRPTKNIGKTSNLNRDTENVFYRVLIVIHHRFLPIIKIALVFSVFSAVNPLISNVFDFNPF